MSVSLKVFPGRPETVVHFQPFVTPTHLSPQGIPLGVDLRSGKAIYFDPWAMRQARTIHSTIFLVLGQKDFGKSTLMKTMALRLMRLQAGQKDGKEVAMRARIDGRRREGDADEYGLITDFLWGETISLHSRASINLFDPALGMDEWDILDTAINVCEMAKGTTLVNYEPLALQVGVNKMLRNNSACNPELLHIILSSLDKSDVDDYYRTKKSLVLEGYRQKFDSDPQLKVQLQPMLERPTNLPASAFSHDAAQVAAYLGRVLYGDYGNMYVGNGSLRDLLTKPVTLWDYSGVNDRAQALLRSMLWKWQTIALNNNDTDIIPHINLGDEDKDALTLMEARFRAGFVAKARSFHTADFRAMQYLSQLTQAGSEGSELRARANDIYQGVACLFIGRQPDNNKQALERFRELGMSKEDVNYLTQLGMGCFAIKVPDHPAIFYQHLITPIEAELVKTNKAIDEMTNRMPATPADGTAGHNGVKVLNGSFKNIVAQNGAIEIGAEPQ